MLLLRTEPFPADRADGRSRGTPLRAAIAIPARDEAARLPACLAALAGQRDAAGAPLDFSGIAVLVMANNCSDGTATLARSLAPDLPFRLLVREVALPASLAHAGGARRAAMDAAAALLEAPAASLPGFLMPNLIRPGAQASAGQPRPALLSTDADGRAAPGWLAANLVALAAGADAVAGTIEPDPAEAARLPASLRRQEAREAHYAALLDELAARIDPDPHDPWPRHGVHSGASIALTLAAYRRVGGLPAVPVGEDRALFEALIRAEMRVRHCPTARVTVSCRLEGRAAGGMADTLRRRLAEAAAAPLDARLEPALDALLRLRCRHALRRLRAGTPRPGDPWRLALALGLRPARLQAIAALPRFWQAWDALQAEAAPLRQRRILLAGELDTEIGRAALLLRGARALVSPRSRPARRAADRDGSARPAPAT